MRRLAFTVALTFALMAAVLEARAEDAGSIVVQGRTGKVVIGPDGSIRVEGDRSSVNVDASIDSAIAGAIDAESISINNGRGEHDCHGGEVSVLGNHNHYTFTHCEKVSVLGNHNNLVLEVGSEVVEVAGNYNHVAVDELSAGDLLGNYNHLVWANSAEEKGPRIRNPGRANRILRK